MASAQPRIAATPCMGQLQVSNHLLGNRAALDAAWERDGYWYFKSILDPQVIATLRKEWIAYLQRLGVIDPGVNENRYNGKELFDDFRDPSTAGRPTDKTLGRILEFNKRNLHKILTESPQVNAVMKQILGDDPFWLPIAEYRANPPGSDPQGERLIYPHQDGFYSRGMPMKICWIPVDYVDEDVGGCAWVGGLHRGPILHDVNNPPMFPIPTEAVPPEGWLRADFEPGDIVIFHLNTPHSGLTNISKDRFRLTFDIRVTEASGPTPVIGPMVRLSEQSVTVRDERTGEEKTFSIDPETFVRSTDGKKREGADIPTTFAVGEEILINSHDGRRATLVRSIH